MNTSPKELLEARAQVFKALGHPTRLAIVDMLVAGERCVCEIHEDSDIDISTISRHLAVLRNVGILSSEKRGNQVYYKLEVPCVTSFYGCVERAINGRGQPISLEGK